MSKYDDLPLSFGKKPQKSSQKTQNSSNAQQDSWSELQAMMKSGFGKKKTKDVVVEKEIVQDEQEEVGPPIPANLEDTPEKQESVSESEEEEGPRIPKADSSVLPITKSCTITEHTKAVTCLSMDRVGDRLLTGSLDFTVRFYNFATMDSSLKAFKFKEPLEDSPVKSLAFSGTGDKFLVVTTAPYAKLFDRDGHQLEEYAKGDPYMTDLRHTKGHVGPATCVRWHPHDKSKFITSGTDSTVRIWTVDRPKQQKDVIVIKSKAKGGTGGTRTIVTTCSYSLNGQWIAAGSVDGCIRLWKSHGPYVIPAITIENAHQPGAEIGCITWSQDHHTIITRATDDTIKLWDINQPKGPLATLEGLLSLHSEINAVFSPDEKVIVTGTSSKPRDEANSGKVLLLNRDTLNPIRALDVGKGVSVCNVFWHPKLNQILAGCSDGKVWTFYDEQVSHRGAIEAMSKAPKKRAIDDIDYSTTSDMILVPGTSDDYLIPNAHGYVKQKRVKKQPVLPAQELALKGSDGRVGTNIVQAYMKQIIGNVDQEAMFSDPRESMLRHAEDAEANPTFIGQAYKETQPTTLYDYEALKREAEKPKEVKRFGQAGETEKK